MNVQCLYQNDPQDNTSILQQRNVCRRAANKLGWQILQERVCDAPEGTPLMLRPDVQELLRDVEQARFQVLVVASAEALRCPEGNWRACWPFCKRGASVSLPPGTAAGWKRAADTGRRCQGPTGPACGNRAG